MTANVGTVQVSWEYCTLFYFYWTQQCYHLLHINKYLLLLPPLSHSLSLYPALTVDGTWSPLGQSLYGERWRLQVILALDCLSVLVLVLLFKIWPYVASLPRTILNYCHPLLMFDLTLLFYICQCRCGGLGTVHWGMSVRGNEPHRSTLRDQTNFIWLGPPLLDASPLTHTLTLDRNSFFLRGTPSLYLGLALSSHLLPFLFCCLLLSPSLSLSLGRHICDPAGRSIAFARKLH